MLNIDTNYSYDNYTEGGSSLTVTGTLANASSVQIGDTSQGINAATTATVRALANYATGTISLYGSSHYLASLNVSQSATNAGTIIIGGHALLAASGLLENSGTIVVSNSATIDISGSIENSGSINMSAGSILSIAPGGTFTQTGGVTTLSGSLVARRTSPSMAVFWQSIRASTPRARSRSRMAARSTSVTAHSQTLLTERSPAAPMSLMPAAPCSCRTTAASLRLTPI